MAWTYLFFAGILECIWPIALKESDGFTKIPATSVALVTGLISLLLLSFAMKDLPISTAYAIWTGLGATGVTIIGVFYYGEPASMSRVVSISLIIAGIVGLRLFGTE